MKSLWFFNYGGRINIARFRFAFFDEVQVKSSCAHPTATMMGCMAVYIESSFGEWKLPIGTSHLGRGVDCTIRLDDLRLSRNHAELVFDGTQLSIKDLGSMNGVLVNGDRIVESQSLNDGAKITLGPFSFTVRFAEDDKDPSRAASEALSQPKPPQRKPSNEFKPSTDRSNKQTVDFDEPISATNLDNDVSTGQNDHSNESSPALTQRRNNTPQSDERRIAPLIEKALQDEGYAPEPKALDPNTSVITEDKNDTDALFPSQQRDRKKKPEALLPLGEDGAHRGNPESDLLLTPLAVEQAPASTRLSGICGDTIIIFTLMAMCILGGMAAGLFLVGQTGSDLAVTTENWQDELRKLHQAGNIPWLSFIGPLSVGVMTALITALFMIVGGSSLSGGAWCHRRLGLVLIDQRSGHFPKPMHCLFHALLGLLTAPLIPVMLLMGQPALHDRICGCSIGRRSR